MKRTKVLISLLIGIILISGSVWYYTSGPTPFLTEEQIVEEMTNHYSIVSNSVIQDIIFLDDRHVFVPFIAEGEIYGLSLWEWSNRKWSEVLVSTSGDIKVWKINSKDPSTYHTVWNFPPQDQVESMKLYLINKRGFQISDSEQRYEPGVQLEQLISLTEDLYGSMKLPKEWNSVIKSLNAYSTFPQYYFGWNTYDSSDKITYPKRNENGGASKGGDIEIEFPLFLEESEPE